MRWHVSKNCHFVCIEEEREDWSFMATKLPNVISHTLEIVWNLHWAGSICFIPSCAATPHTLLVCRWPPHPRCHRSNLPFPFRRAAVKSLWAYLLPFPPAISSVSRWIKLSGGDRKLEGGVAPAGERKSVRRNRKRRAPPPSSSSSTPPDVPAIHEQMYLRHLIYLLSWSRAREIENSVES